MSCVTRRYYYEYPEVLATITKDVVFGVSFGLGSFTLDPFGWAGTNETSFSWKIGGLAVEYNPPAKACFELGVAWEGGTDCAVHGMQAGGLYEWAGGKIRADEEGVVRLRVPSTVSATCVVLTGV